jgi:hypothetical protein
MTMRVLVTSVTEDKIGWMDAVIERLAFRKRLRVRCHPAVDAAIINIMPRTKHNITHGKIFTTLLENDPRVPQNRVHSSCGLGSARAFTYQGNGRKNGT